MATGVSGLGRDEHARREAASDLHATLGARRELGADYDQVLADAFVERVDMLVAARVSDELARRHGQPRAYPPGVLPPGATAVPRPEPRYPISLAYLSLVAGVPITAIASGTNDSVWGVVAAWTGIGAVNAITAWGYRLRHGTARPD
ncbi:MAG TPA: hypothetical protein VEY14_02520 [Nocardioidaceae bacterium]|jgi:hypothetical protein|nr:hypothetical protein [Nocardioidaceae bacterium]